MALALGHLDALKAAFQVCRSQFASSMAHSSMASIVVEKDVLKKMANDKRSIPPLLPRRHS